jgi:hypothetical protein
MAPRLRFLGCPRLALILILGGAAALAASCYWMATRTFVAVDMPVSLGPGHLRTGPFLINVEANYWIAIEMDDDSPTASCYQYSVLHTRASLSKASSRAGRMVPTSDELGGSGTLGRFDGERGIYNLDVEVLSDARCLNVAHPRLRVFTSRDAFANAKSFLIWLSAICLGAGASLSVIDRLGRPRKLPPHVVPEAPEFSLGHLPVRRRPSDKRRFTGLPAYGLIAFLTLLLIWIPNQVLHAWGVRTSKGLLIHIVKPGPAAPTRPGIPALLVHVKSDGTVEVNLQEASFQIVSWEDFDTVMRKELGRRPPTLAGLRRGRSQHGMEGGHASY